MFATVGIVLFWALKIKHLSFKTYHFPKGVLLGCKRVRFACQKDYICIAKGLLLKAKRSPF